MSRQDDNFFDSFFDDHEKNNDVNTGDSTPSSPIDDSVFVPDSIRFTNPNHHHHHHRHHSESSVPKKKRSKPVRVLQWVLILISLLLVVSLGAFSVFYFVGKNQLLSGYEEVKVELPVTATDRVIDSGKYIERNGKKYKLNTNITSVAFLGVDKPDIVDTKEKIGHAGQADAIVLAAIDLKTKSCKLINISRDTMVDVNLYSETGTYAGVDNLQICLSYAYGNGGASSCANTLRSISRLMYNIPINTYFAMDMNGISVLNDTVGGVKVREYDLKGKPTGETITISGDEAESYLRDRNTTDVDANNARVKRQTEYIKGLVNTVLSKAKSNLNTTIDIYNTMSDYMTTSFSVSKVAYMTTALLGGGGSPEVKYLSVPGKVTLGSDKLAEYHVDNDKLIDLVLDAYYTPVK